MPVVKKSAAKREKPVVLSEDEKSVLLADVAPADMVEVSSPVPTVKREAVSFTENVLTVDLTALEALPQGKRQAAVKTARAFLDRASQ